MPRQRSGTPTSKKSMEDIDKWIISFQKTLKGRIFMVRPKKPITVEEIRKVMKDHPTWSPKKIGEVFNVSNMTVFRRLKQTGG